MDVKLKQRGWGLSGRRSLLFSITFVGFCLCAVGVSAYLSTSKENFSVASKSYNMITLGAATTDCGQFLNAVDNELPMRLPSTPDNMIMTVSYANYVAFADGFVVSVNETSKVEHLLGQGTTYPGRIRILEDYCHQHPLDSYLRAVEHLVEELQQNANK